MPITDWDHYTVRSKDAAASWAFYEQGLGLNVRKREGFAIPAFIVSIGDREVVHVFQASAEMEAIFAKLPAAEQLQGWTTGRLHHVEFWASDLQTVRARLGAHGVAVTERTLPDKHQLHMTDPDGFRSTSTFRCPRSRLGRSRQGRLGRLPCALTVRLLVRFFVLAADGVATIRAPFGDQRVEAAHRGPAEQNVVHLVGEGAFEGDALGAIGRRVQAGDSIRYAFARSAPSAPGRYREQNLANWS